MLFASQRSDCAWCQSTAQTINDLSPTGPMLLPSMKAAVDPAWIQLIPPNKLFGPEQGPSLDPRSHDHRSKPCDPAG